MSTANPVTANLKPHRAPTLRLTLAVAGVITGLFLVDVSLEKTEQAEISQSASRADRQGHQLLQQGKANEAVDAFRKAHALQRENVQYEIDLIDALMAAGKLAEAQPLVAEVLEEQSNDGEVNLVAARLTAKQGRINSADAYYHRAIYGQWSGDVTQHQIQVRMELIDFLTAHNKQGEVLAELLPLEEQAGKDLSLQPKIAKLFLEAGSPARALAIYRELVRHNSKDASYFEGVGNAELDLGDFRDAHGAFAAAVARAPTDAALRKRLETATQLYNLDPSPRWLSSQEKYSRSIRILQLASGNLQQCVENHPQLATGEATQIIQTAQTQLAAPVPKLPTNEASENALSLAEHIWKLRVSLCGTGTADDEEPLRLIMEKLASAR